MRVSMKESPEKSPHILNTSANLLGLCFIVLRSRSISDMKGATYIDEGTACAILAFMTSCVLSFLSIRKQSTISDKFEEVADMVF